LATVHTGGKALGVPGAYVAGSRPLCDYLVNRCRHFVFTTALPPACAAWWLEMLPRVQGDAAGRAALHANARRFRAALAAAGVVTLGTEHLVPVPLGDDGPAVAAAAIRPPTVAPGTCRLRVSIHRDHEPALLDRLAADVADVVAGPRGRR
jgi:8-amino-7-oxononanoate synthase